MVTNNKFTVGFIEATDFLKNQENQKHGEICNQIGLKRWQYDQIRIGRRIPSKEVIEKLTQIFPITLQFFDKSNTIVNEPEVKYNTTESELVKSLREIIKSKNKVIELLEAKVKDLEDDVNARREAHAETLAQLYTVEEAEALVKELKEKMKGE